MLISATSRLGTQAHATDLERPGSHLLSVSNPVPLHSIPGARSTTVEYPARAVQAQSISSACSRVSPWQQRCGTARTMRQAEGQGERRSWHQRPHPCCGHAVWQWRLAQSLWRPTVGVTDATRPGALEVKWRCPLASSWRPLCGSWWAGTVHPAPQPSGQGIQSPIRPRPRWRMQLPGASVIASISAVMQLGAYRVTIFCEYASI